MSWLDPELGVTGLALIAVALLAGAVVQGVVGLGLGLVAAPVVTLVDPALMPGGLLMLGAVLPLVTLVREHEDIDWHGLGWSLPARLVGTGVGAALVVLVSDRLLSIGVAVMVLVAVTLTAREVRVSINRASLSVAGFVSGVTGTATSIGGPPFALLYQHRPAHEARATMAVFFVMGAGLSLAGLAISGELTQRELALAVFMVPALVAGVVIAVPLRRRINAAHFRNGVLVVSAVSSLVLLARALL